MFITPALTCGVTANNAFQASYALRAVIPSRRYGWELAYRQLRSLRSLAGGYDCIALRAGNAACDGDGVAEAMVWRRRPAFAR